MPDGTEVTWKSTETTEKPELSMQSGSVQAVQASKARVFTGRRVIYTDETRITKGNIRAVLDDAMVTHHLNSGEIKYLFEYYRGKQPILDRPKQVRPEICNKVVENHAYEIVGFKIGYVFGEPIQYVSKNNDSEKTDEHTAQIGALNDYMFAAGKITNDRDLGECQCVCGTAYRLVLPLKGQNIDAPFEIHSLNPETTFIVYANNYRKTPMMGVTYTVNSKTGETIYDCYTDREYFRVTGEVSGVVEGPKRNALGIPIVEYPANNARLGAFEPVVSMLDAINTTRSNQVDGVEQFIQSFLKFVNVDIDVEGFERLRAEGAIKVNSPDGKQADVDIVSQELNQGETETLLKSMYQTVLTICGVPNRNPAQSVPDTGAASLVGNGWTIAETQAKDLEIMFKKAEQQFLKLILKIMKIKADLNLSISNIDIKFTRRNYEAIQSKAQVLTTMLGCEKIAPLLAFEACGMFPDIESAYAMSLPYIEKSEKAKEPPPPDPESEPKTDPTDKGVEDKIRNNVA